MNARLALLALAGAGVIALVLLRERGTDAGGAPDPRPGAARAARSALASPPPAAPARNVFEYAEAPAARTPPRPAAPVAPAPVEPVASQETPPTPDPVRLVGLVRRGGALRAALSIDGEVVILGAGESAEGYRVLAIDEEAGVRLKGPDGAERALAPPERP